MKKDNWLLTLALVSLALTLAVYFRLPEEVPVHWNVQGQVDGTGSRIVSLALGALPVGLYHLMMLMPRYDKKLSGVSDHGNAFRILRMVIILFFIAFHWTALTAALGYDVDMTRMVTIGVGLLFVVIGRILGRIEHNAYMGIRTPWTMSSEEVWDRTHKAGGQAFWIAGLTIASSTFLPGNWGIVLSLIVIFATVAGLFIYSYWLARKSLKNR